MFSEKGFPIQHKDALATQIISPSKETMVMTFIAPKDTELAFKVLHDEDSNNKVTKNWTGIWPREGLGFSNGKTMGRFGPPSFEEAKIHKKSSLKGVTLKLAYP